MSSLIARLRAKDRWIPMCFVAFFLGLFAVEAVLVTIALRNFNGVAVEDHYHKGLAYNDTLDALERQSALGWRPDLTVEPTGERRARAELALTDAAGAPLTGAAVEAEIDRVIERGHDFATVLHEIEPGRYVADLAVPLPGRWRVTLAIRHGDDRFVAAERVVLR